MKENNYIINKENFDVLVDYRKNDLNLLFPSNEENVSIINMKYCQKCGKEILDEAVVCPNCGCEQKSYIHNNEDSDGLGWSFLGFIIPLVGLILYIVWRKDMPLRAKSVGKGAIISVIILAVFWIILFIICIGFAILESNSNIYY